MKNNERGLFKRGDNWYIKYFVNGKRFREAVGPNKQFARELRAKRLVQIKEGTFFDIKQDSLIVFDEIVKDYMAFSQNNKLSHWRDKILVRHLMDSFRSQKLTAITPNKIEEYKRLRLLKVKPATVNRELTCMKTIFSWAIKNKRASYNPVKDVKFLKEDNRRLRFLDEDEISRLIDACSMHLRPVVITALCTGMRKAEILELKWDDVNFDEGFITLIKTKNGKQRKIPISATLRETLQECRKWSDGTFVFCNERNKPYSRNIRTNFLNALKRADITDFRFHDTRHTAASHLVMNGVDLTTVMEILGHSTMNMTLRYSHLAPRHIKDAVEQLGNVVKKATAPKTAPRQISPLNKVSESIAKYIVNTIIN